MTNKTKGCKAVTCEVSFFVANRWQDGQGPMDLRTGTDRRRSERRREDRRVGERRKVARRGNLHG